MNVDDNWIPADSSYELTMLNYLHNQGRAFIKPLRYDASNNDVFPDFCLTDTGGHELFPIEVFGMDTASYLAVRRLKKVTIMNDMERTVGHHGLHRLAPYLSCHRKPEVSPRL